MNPDIQKRDIHCVLLSSCGTSLLTNIAPTRFRSLVVKYANARQKEDIPAEQMKTLETMLAEARARLKDADIKEARSLSAELNGIVTFYNGCFPDRADLHLLLCSDTWLGREIASLIGQWIGEHGSRFIIHVYCQKDLHTADFQDFHVALADLVEYLDKFISDSQASGYHVVFNLTGGFKSVQGFLQSISHLYADETVYIFETSNQLLRIPRLPLKLDTDVVKKHHIVLRRIVNGLPVKQSSIEGLPGSFLFMLDDQACLSAWGKAFTLKILKIMYSEKIWPPISPKVIYDEGFIKTSSSLDGERKGILNRRLDDLARCLEQDSKMRSCPASLGFKKLQGNPVPPATHEFYAWSDKNGGRVFGYFQGERFLVWKLGEHL